MQTESYLGSEITRMIRILYVERPHNIGGSVISLYHLVAGLDRAVFEPLVLFRRSNPYRERFASIGVPVITLAETPMRGSSPSELAPSQRDIAAALSRYSRSAAAGYRTAKFVYHVLGTELPLARRIRQIIEAEAVDLVHTNNSLPNNRPGVLAARWAGVPVICHFRMFKAINAFDRWLGQHVVSHVYISNAVAAHHIAQGLPPERSKVIYNAVDLDQFDPLGDGVAVRRELGLRPEHLVVGNVSRLDWWKGHDVFLQAVARLAGHMPELRVLIVGGVDDRPANQAYVANLRALTRELGLAKRVTFTGHRDDIPDVMAALDLVVHSATQPEPFGRVVIEALAARRPIVATAAGGVPEIIEDGVHGLLVPPGDTPALANAMESLLLDRPRAETMATAGRQRIQGQFTIQRQAQVMQTLYQDVSNRYAARLRSSQCTPRPGYLKGTVRGWLHSLKLSPGSPDGVLAAYDLGVLHELKPLSGESRSRNVLVSTDRGCWMLKAYKASLDAEAIAFEHSLLKYLAACEFPAPRLVPARSGETCVQHEGCRYALYQFVVGHPLDRLLLSPSRRRAYLTRVARILGRYHETVAGFVPEGRKLDGYRSDNVTRWRDHRWFAGQIACYRGYLRSRQSQDRLLLDRLEVVEHELLDLGERLTHQGATATRLAIHGDVGPYNLLVRPGGSVMLLDFECAHLELRAYDVISALATFAGRRDGSIDLAKAARFVEAYQKIWPLERGEVQLMPDLFRYVKLSGLVWRLRDAVTQERPLEAGWLQTRLACADWLAQCGEKLVTALLRGAVYSSAG